MRVLEGEQFLVRIFFGESEKWHHQLLSDALLERLRKEGFAGATVFRGVSGFGASSIIRTVHIVDLSADLPIVIEVVDDEEHVQKLQPILDEMVTGGALVTMQRVSVLKYVSGKRASNLPPPPSSTPNAT